MASAASTTHPRASSDRHPPAGSWSNAEKSRESIADLSWEQSFPVSVSDARVSAEASASAEMIIAGACLPENDRTLIDAGLGLTRRIVLEASPMPNHIGMQA